jgi:hypothetical protein
MPRLSLYRPEKGNDFRMLDRVINEQFQVGGTDVFIHKYLGPSVVSTATVAGGVTSLTNPTTPELGIQDVIFMENRDRSYDPDIYQIRGIYTMNDIDFNLSQFGLFLSNNDIMITFHLRGCVETIGRKLMAGDVLELPHLKDEYASNDDLVALKRFYVVTDVSRPASGYSQTWYPHLLRAKLGPLVDSQEFAEILNASAGDGNKTLRDVLSVYSQNIAINNAIVAQAEADAPLSGYDTTPYFVLPLKDDGTGAGTLMTEDASMTDVDASLDNPAVDASAVLKSPATNLYVGKLNESGIPPNGAPYSFGIAFPAHGVVEGQFFLRTDFVPNRLFRFDGQTWVKWADNLRMTMTNNYDPTMSNQDPTQPQSDTRNRISQKTGFINNNNTATIAGKVVQERQALSKALKPTADN